MPVAKLSRGSTPDPMKGDEVNDSLDTLIKQAMGKEPLLSFPRTEENPGQWIQWLHSLDQPDIAGWPLLTPAKVQMHKCEKCSREFCSLINYRRHIRLHRRLLNFDKESRKYRDLLGAFWDKLSVDTVKEVASLQEISLKEITGSSLVHALAAALGKPGFWALPRDYVKAGSKLLEVIQAKPSRLPLSSQELFGILDDASERTFLCAGTAESMEKYVFDGEAAKIGFDSKNLIACTCFLFEQKLVKAWATDKDAEALRCQKLLFEEEDAAQKKQADLLERKKVKKLRQKEQKVREISNEEKGNVERPADCYEVPLAKVSYLPEPTHLDSNMRDASLDTSTCPELVQSCSNEDKDVESQYEHLDLVKVRNVEPQPVSAEVSNLPKPCDSDSNIPDVSLDTPTCAELVQSCRNEDKDVESQYEHLDLVEVQNVEPQAVSTNSRRHGQRQAPKSQRFGRNRSHRNQASKVELVHKHKDSGGPVNSSKIWTRKVRGENEGTSTITDEKQSSCEVMIGSIPIPVRDSITLQQWNFTAEARDASGSTEPKKCDNVGRQEPEEGIASITFNDGTSSDGNVHYGLKLSSIAARAFLARRWAEAIAGDHTVLVLSSGADVQNGSSEPEPAPDGGLSSSSSGNSKSRYRLKQIPKQKEYLKSIK